MSVNKGTANPASKSLFPTYTENEKNMVIKKMNMQKREILIICPHLNLPINLTWKVYEDLNCMYRKK